MIPFNTPPYTGKETSYIAQTIKDRKLSGDGGFTRRCSEWLEQNIGGASGQSCKALLTTSCTHALEMAALLCGIKPGDEVIMPSYTFVSTANAFVLRGAKIVFVDIKPGTMKTWSYYQTTLKPLQEQGVIELPHIPAECEHNAHMFYVKAKNLDERTRLIQHLKENDILSVFHYVPLHSSTAGQRYSRFSGEDRHTTKESERLLRLPLYYGMPPGDAKRVTDAIYGFYDAQKQETIDNN